MARDFFNDVGDAAVEAYHGKHAARQQRDDDEFPHSGHAVAHGAEPVHAGEVAHAYADRSRGQQPQGQYGHHVDTRQSRGQHQQVGEHLEPFYLHVRACRRRLDIPARQHVAGQGEQRGGQDHLDVGPEFVPHGAALRAGGGDGSV